MYHPALASQGMGQSVRKPDQAKKVAVSVATSVIIPARNEEATIGNIVAVFAKHPETSGRVHVFIDSHTVDGTHAAVWANGGIAIHTDRHGKGEVVVAGAKMLAMMKQDTHRVILCDGDYTGLTTKHVTKILAPPRGMTIGVPEFPKIDVPEHVTMAWPHISGFRCLPIDLIPDDAHGYLLETQLNKVAIRRQMPQTRVMMDGLHAPFSWPLAPRRMEALLRDRDWGLMHGVL